MLPGAVALLFCIYIFYTLAVANGYMLRWVDDMSLWQPGFRWLRDMSAHPGGIFWYAGAWLTQFFFYPWAGVGILLLLWLGMGLLTVGAFRIPRPLWALSLLAPVALAASIGTLDEAWISIKSPGFAYSPTLGFSFSIACAFAARCLSSRKGWLLMWCWAVGLTWIWAGFYALIGAVLSLASFFPIGGRRGSALASAAVTGVAAIALGAPPAFYRLVPGIACDSSFLWLKGLPALSVSVSDLGLWMPFISAAGCILALALASAIGWPKPTRASSMASVAFLAVVMAACIPLQKKSEEIHAVVLMQQRMERGDWESIRSIMGRLKSPPSYTMMVINNLALVKSGMPPADIAGLSPARRGYRHDEDFTMSAFVQVPVYCHLGRFNQSYRWAMEHTVQFGPRAFYLKYMVVDALGAGEDALARKYNDMLLRTLFHRRWALEMAQCHAALR